jgi:hypothetical protein
MIPQHVVDWVREQSGQRPDVDELLALVEKIANNDEILAGAVFSALPHSSAAIKRLKDYPRAYYVLRKTSGDLDAMTQAMAKVVELRKLAGLPVDEDVTKLEEARLQAKNARVLREGQALIKGHHICTACNRKMCVKHPRKMRAPCAPELVEVIASSRGRGIDDTDRIKVRFTPGGTAKVRFRFLSPVSPLEALGAQAE